MHASSLRGFCRFALPFVIALALLPASRARAADDTSEAQAIIRSQVQALERDDAATAYSYASPVIQQLFPGADIFLGMVRDGYPPIYRHRSFDFGEAKTVDGKVLQRASIVDTDGGAWEALYTVERQSDGSLKIAGCVLLKVGTAV